jgi:hypothetical protein
VVEIVHGRQRAAGGDLEDRAITVGSASRCCSVQNPIAGLHQSGIGIAAVCLIEAMQRGESLRG